MDTVKVFYLIETTLTRRGDGKSEASPIRIITQYWTPAGALVVEHDPAAVILTPEKRWLIQQIIFQRFGENDKAREAISKIEAELG